MPYRRLPNTDSARMRAMQRALQKSEGLPPFKLSFSVATYQELKYFFPEFKQAIVLQKDSLDRQTDNARLHQESLKKAKLYISHFIQVLNFSIIRGELKPETREIFGLESDERKLPQLSTEKDVVELGERLIKGEQTRLASGFSPITNPTIARVKVHYEDFLRLHKTQKIMQESNSKALTKVAILREKADDIILKLWNEIEDSFAQLPADEKRAKAENFGVVYVYRKNEKLNFSNLKLGSMVS